MNLDEMTLAEMKIKAAAIRSNNSHWKSSQDGSYEMALSGAGYYKLCERIKKLEQCLKELDEPEDPYGVAY